MLTVFYISSVLVVLALLVALYSWYRIAMMRTGKSARAAKLFVVCFLLYVVGQTLVILDVAGFLSGWGYIASYLYAIAALFFAVGSYTLYKVESSASSERHA